jgi:hypothetical protein
MQVLRVHQMLLREDVVSWIRSPKNLQVRKDLRFYAVYVCDIAPQLNRRLWSEVLRDPTAALAVEFLWGEPRLVVTSRTRDTRVLCVLSP